MHFIKLKKFKIVGSVIFVYRFFRAAAVFNYLTLWVWISVMIWITVRVRVRTSVMVRVSMVL